MYKYLLFLCLFATSICNAQTYQPVPGDTSGYTEGGFTVTDGGAATYRFAPVITSGTGGLQPTISFSYNSQGGNGLMGLGWSIEGLSAISRASQTRAQDGQIKGISFSGTDRFALDGERLILTDTNNTYGSDGVEYRTEQNAIYRIISHSTGTTPDYFRAENKAGLIMEYGYTVDAKVTVNNNTTIHWLLDKISDRYGNYITFSYYQNTTTGEYYPLEINYTGNTITNLQPHASLKFEYENRIDSVQRYLNGRKIANSTKRLKALKCYYGLTQYRSYTFNYQYSQATLSELISFQECGLNGSCNAPTTFNWTNLGNLVFSTTNITNVQQGATQNKIFSSDLNNDGVQDISRIVQGGNLELYASNRSVTALGFSSMIFNPAIVVGSKIAFGDFNGDSKQDMLLYDSLSGTNTISINTTTVAGTQIANNQTASPIPSSLFSSNKQVVIIDINGDGRSDIFTFDPATGNNYWLFSKSTGSASLSFEPNGSLNYFSNLFSTTLFTGSYQPFFTDLNNDGLTDVLFFNTANGNTLVYQNSGGTITSFSQVASNIITPASLMATGGKLILSDMNADNLPDILYYVKSTGANSWWINRGDNTFLPQIPTPSSLASSISGGDNLLQIDFNQDGFTDLVWMDKASGANRWFVNDGKLNFNQLSGTIITPSELAGYNLQGIGNFTSRSSFDLFLFNDALTPKAKILKGSLGMSNVITKITCGNGQATDITYDFLTNDSLYTKDNTALYPLVDYQATHAVVKSYQVDNGVGGKNITSFHYAGAKIHSNGRGFRGFTEIEEKDWTTGITEIRTYLADTNSWKFINAPMVTQVRKLANGTVINRTDIENGLKTYFAGKCYFSYVVSSTTKNYETNGSFIDSVRTTNYYEDDYANVNRTVTDYGGGAKDSLYNVFNNFANDWILSRLVSCHLYRMAPGKPTIVKASAFEYDPVKGGLKREISESDSGSTVRIIKGYLRDASYGNILQDTVIAWNGSAVDKRITITTYDSLSRFPVTITNAIGQTATKIYDPVLGHAKNETTANNHTTQSFRDNMGRLIKMVNPDGTWSSQDYRKCGGAQSCPLYATHLIYQQSSNSPPIVTYYNLLNQEVRKKTTGFNGTTIYVDRVYNARGLLVQETEPYFIGNTPNLVLYEYDELARPTRTIRPGNRIDSVKYNGHTTITINPLGQSNTIIKDSKGNIITTIDNQNNVLNLEYDAANRRSKTTDPNGNNILWEYDIHGNIIKETDPDRGITTSIYNGFGELISVTRGSNTAIMKYDSAGRIKQRVELEGITRWYYDGQPRSLGLLDSVVHYNSKETILRDSLGRDTAYFRRIDGRTFIRHTVYDSIGRIKTVFFNTGFSETYVYNAYGYLYQVKNTATNIAYYTSTSVNAKGQLEQLLYGNGTQVNKIYDATTNYLTGINTKKGTTFLQNMSFTNDAIGNLTQRKDLLQNKQEDFWMDNLNRLTKAKVLNGDSVLIQYNGIGNIVSKSDVGNYTYGGVNAGPHRVVAVSGPNAACVPSLLVDTKYNSFEKIREITKDSMLVTIQYDANRQRNLQKMFDSSHLVRIKVYAFPDLEQEIKGSDTITTHHVFGPDGTVASYITHTQAGLAAATSYYHRDHLGSTVMVTNDTGGIAAKFSFDAWGRRRNANWAALLTDTASLLADRGFTGHEHYDLFELVDMNGRLYDPVLARFTSADPVIQDVYNLQCLNRYSYCANNPLSLIDPSGHSFLSRLFKGIGHAFSSAVNWVGDNWKSLATVAVTLVVGTLTAGWGSVFLSGAAAGFSGSVTSTLLAGGNLGDALKAGIKGAVIGGITADLTAGVGDKFGHQTTLDNMFDKAVRHGIIQGTANVAQGGDFIHGFLAGAATTSMELQTNKLETYYGRVTASAIVGGTASKLSGGNFVNGAVSGAFVQMYNEEILRITIHPDRDIPNQEVDGNNEKSRLEKVGTINDIIGIGTDLQMSAIGRFATTPGELEAIKFTGKILSGPFNAAGIAMGSYQIYHDPYNTSWRTYVGVGLGVASFLCEPCAVVNTVYSIGKLGYEEIIAK